MYQGTDVNVMTKKLKTLNYRGDTIVEVMVALLVLGLSLAGAYSIASKSLKASRQAQEHGEALKLAESQLETLKAQAAGNTASTIFTIASPFCMAGSTAVAASDAQCTSSSLYQVSVDRTDLSDSNRYQFDVSVIWPSAGQSVEDRLDLRYRLIKEN